MVFGRVSGFAANLNLSTLDGSNGFSLGGVAVNDQSGRSVSAAGDVNGDGFGDVIVGAYLADPNGTNSGASYVVFGKASGFAPNLNLSILDGLWMEGYDGRNGFAIGRDVSGDANVDASDAESLYNVLETEVVPLYYQRDADGLPRKWIAMMKHAIATLAPAFNSDRMVEDYAKRIYS